MNKVVRRTLNIVAYIFIGLLFLLSIVGIVVKANNGTLYLFNVRGDIVLSDSMSTKNEKYEEFLEGYDNQLHKMDIIFSEKVGKDTELNVYDVVLFDNPGIGTTVHRIVGKQVIDQDVLSFRNARIGEFNGNSVIYMPELSSIFETSKLRYTEVELTLLSKSEYDNRFRFGPRSAELSEDVQSTQIDDYYKHTIKLTKSSSLPTTFSFTYGDHCDDYDAFVFSSIKINAESGNVDISAGSFAELEGNQLNYITNLVYEYEIRGDAAADSDGKFTIDNIYSRATFTIPKLGIFVRYVTSIYGIILFIGIGGIMLASSIILDRANKKEKKTETKESDEEKK